MCPVRRAAPRPAVRLKDGIPVVPCSKRLSPGWDWFKRLIYSGFCYRLRWARRAVHKISLLNSLLAGNSRVPKAPVASAWRLWYFYTYIEMLRRATSAEWRTACPCTGRPMSSLLAAEGLGGPDDVAVGRFQDHGDCLSFREFLAEAQRGALPIADGSNRANDVSFFQRATAVLATPN
jgi:hypothetical protein